MSGILDRMPSWARHLVILVGLTSVTALLMTFANDVIAEGGVSSLDWARTATESLDNAALAASAGLLGWIALVITPLTKKYGVGASTFFPSGK